MSQLTNYIQKELDKGFSKDLITKKLLQANYTQQEISDSFKSLKSAEPILRRKFADTLHLETHIRWSRWVFGLLALVVVLVLGFLVYQYQGAFPLLPTEEQPEPSQKELLQAEIRHCNNAEDRRLCIADLAIEYQDISLCDGGVLCTATFAAAQNDGALCLRFQDQDKQTSCLSLYYEATGDSTYCTAADILCGYRHDASYDEKKIFFAEKFASFNLEENQEDILEFVIENNEPVVCEYWKPGADTSFVSVLTNYALEPYELCIIALVSSSQDTEYCTLLTENVKNRLCLNIVTCSTDEEICNALH